MNNSKDAPQLIVFDMDGVICEHFNFWLELHKVWGTLEEGKELTKKYLKTDYGRLVQEVIGRLWAGKPAQPYYDLAKYIRQHNGRVIGFMYEPHAEVEKNCGVVVRQKDLMAILPYIKNF